MDLDSLSTRRLPEEFHFEEHLVGGKMNVCEVAPVGRPRYRPNVRPNLICPVSQIASEIDPWNERMNPAQFPWPRHKVQQ